MNKLLEGDNASLQVLRTQLGSCEVARRKMSGVGFFLYFEVPASAPTLSKQQRFYIGDVHAKIGGLEHGAGFVLFVEDGQIAMLEGYTYGEAWPGEVSQYELQYEGGERDHTMIEERVKE